GADGCVVKKDIDLGVFSHGEKLPPFNSRADECVRPVFLLSCARYCYRFPVIFDGPGY
ncbi:MAG: hypothetical protein PWQ84_1839, partial [Thermotogaceae bacterium]|nr:hypothetical protein [Thermotogaceae bacterium]